MNLKQAIESGKRFKHKDYGPNVWEEANGDYVIPSSITWEQVASDEWEIEEKKVEITESQFGEAWRSWGTEARLEESLFDHVKEKLFGKDG